MSGTWATSGGRTEMKFSSHSSGLENVKVGARLRGFVSHVVDPVSFYIQFQNDLPYPAMNAALQSEYDLDVIACPDLNQLREGQVYAALRHGVWFRVLLEKLLHKGTGLIFFLDTGHRQTIQLSDIFYLNAKFSSLPAQAIYCQLQSVLPSALKDPVWQEELLLFFKSLIENCKVIASVEEIIHGDVGRVLGKELTLRVSLFADLDESSINSKLITSKYYVAQEPEPQSNVVALVTQSNCDHSMASNYSSACSSPEVLEQMEMDDDPLPRQSVTVCHVVDPGDFYVQRISDESRMVQVRNLINSTYQNCEKTNVTPVQIRTAEHYAVQSPVNHLWYRSRCVSAEDALGGYSHDYFLIDEGCTLRVFKNGVRPLSTELRIFPPMAMRCRLDVEVPEAGWTADDVETFKNLLEKRTWRMTVIRKVDDVLSVDLNQVASSSSEQAIYSIRDRLQRHIAKKLRITYHAYSSGDRMTGRVIRAYTPFHIYIQPVVSDDREFSVMSAQLQVECNVPVAESCLAVDSLQIGVVYAAQRLNGRWGRAIVESVTSNGTAVAVFVDYGERRQIKRSSLRRLRERFLKLPARVIRCKLSFIRCRRGKKKFWTKKHISDFRDLLIGASNVVVVVQKSLVPSYKPRRFAEALLFAKIFTNRSRTSLNSLLVSAGLAVWTKNPDRLAAASLVKQMLAHSQGRPSVLSELGHVTPVDWLTVSALAAEVTALESRCRPFDNGERTQTIGRMPQQDDYVMHVRFLMCQSSESIFFRPVMYESRFLSLQSQLQFAYRNVIGQIPSCNPGTWCAAYVYGQWIRAVILDFDENLQCSISSLDTGQVLRISMDQIYPLLEPFVCVPRLAIKCSLIGRTAASDCADMVSRISNALLLADEIFICCRQRPRAISSNLAVNVVFRRSVGNSDVFIDLNHVLRTAKQDY